MTHDQPDHARPSRARPPRPSATCSRAARAPTGPRRLPAADWDLGTLAQHVVGTTTGMIKIGRREDRWTREPLGRPDGRPADDWSRRAGRQPGRAGRGLERRTRPGGAPCRWATRCRPPSSATWRTRRSCCTAGTSPGRSEPSSPVSPAMAGRRCAGPSTRPPSSVGRWARTATRWRCAEDADDFDQALGAGRPRSVTGPR